MKTLHSLFALFVLFSASCATNDKVTRSTIENASAPCQEWTKHFVVGTIINNDNTQLGRAYADKKAPGCQDEAFKQKLIADH